MIKKKILPHYWKEGKRVFIRMVGAMFSAISFQPDVAESGTQVCTLNGQKRARLSGPCGGVAFVISPSITETECWCLHCGFVHKEDHVRLSALYCNRTPPHRQFPIIQNIRVSDLNPGLRMFQRFPSPLSAVKLASGIGSGWTIPGRLRPSGARLRRCLQAPTCGAPRARRTCPTTRARGRSRRAGALTTARASERPFGWSRVRLLMVFIKPGVTGRDWFLCNDLVLSPQWRV